MAKSGKKGEIGDLERSLTPSEDALVQGLVDRGEEQDMRVLAKNLVSKITIILLKSKPRELAEE